MSTYQQNSQSGIDALVERARAELQSPITRFLVDAQDNLRARLGRLEGLPRALRNRLAIPPLSGWAATPDVLRRLHDHIRVSKPRLVVECGSGISTVVIAKALKENGSGRLVSMEHSALYGGRTREVLAAEGLMEQVDLRIGELAIWERPHLNTTGETLRWYPLAMTEDLDSIDLLLVDGPPGRTCKYVRYPALPALADRFSERAEVWLDDTVRRQEVEIATAWVREYGFELEFLPLAKGLGRLYRRQPDIPSRGD